MFTKKNNLMINKSSENLTTYLMQQQRGFI
jgi:hypothetical protein